MKKRTTQLKALLVFVGILAVAVTASLSVASAKTPKPVVVPPDAALTWNTYAVNAVRASTPTKVQTDGMVYMSYAQAAVYDAVTKLEGRYEPYHDFAFAVAPGASVQAAVAAAARTILDYYLPDQQPAVDAEYAAYLATLTGNIAGGVALGEAAANDIIAFRTGDGLKAATPSYGGIGPILPGQWQLQPGQSVQTPWLATMRPFLLDRASQFRAEPPPSLTSHRYAKDLNETEAYGALNSTVRTPEQKAIAYFWVGNNINQYNQTMQNVVAQHGMDLVEATHLIAMGELVTTDAGIACFDTKFFYQVWRPITAIRNADKDGNPDTTADPSWQSLLPVPGHPEYPSQHGCFTAAFSDALAAALHTNHLDVTMPGGQNGFTTLTTTQHFNTVGDMQKQVVDARVWLGFHFRNSVEQGERLGNDVASWELKRYFEQADE
ncbi:MAG: vanadium-dependent haloperoxidase [Actinomycetota bacterium]|nr:vanadium-dependent haloperoxidase [Actinomycetota bacterium]